MIDDTLTCALELAELGFRVFPCRNKEPLTHNGCTGATTDPETISAWWAKWPDAQVSIATGRGSGVFVVDVDVYKGGSTPEGLPATLTARTPRGGLHLYFLHPGGKVPNSQSKVAPNVDVRGDGGYVVAPPSGGYEWVGDTSDVAEAPAWLLTAANRLKESALTVAVTDQLEVCDPLILEQARADLVTHGPAVQGKGGDAHTFSTGALLLHNYALRWDEAWPLACEWNATCQPPWSLPELATKLRNGHLYARGIKGDRRELLVVPWDIEPADIELTSVTRAVSSASAFEQFATDLGNAHLLVRLFGDRLRYIHDWGKWCVWNGKCWAIDLNASAMRAAHRTVEHLQELAEAAQREVNTLKDRLEALQALLQTVGRVATREEEQLEQDLQQRLEPLEVNAGGAWKRYVAAQSNNALTNMVKQASTLHPVAITSAHLDADPMLLNVGNGTLDLRTGQLRAHDRADLLTKTLTVEYDASAEAPMWDRFLNEVMCGDAEMVAYLRRAVGYTLTGDVSDHGFFFCHGDGANGKSTFIGTIQRMMGDFAVQAAPDLLLKRMNRHDSDTSNLPGVRMLICGEPGLGRTWDDALIKQLTGGDMISGRFMGKERFTFAPSHKIWIASNPLPDVGGQDNGIWRRVKLISFNLNLPEAQRDLELPRKLVSELSGILTWAVRGCQEWQARKLDEPASMKQDVSAYRKQEDIYRTFLEESCETGPGFTISRKALYSTYVIWCQENGFNNIKSTKVFTGEMIRLKLGEAKHNGERLWEGARIRSVGLHAAK